MNILFTHKYDSCSVYMYMTKQMLEFLSTIFIYLSLSLSVYADDTDDFYNGVAAYDKGDYQTAIQLWKPLAEQGYAQAQFNLGIMYDNGYGVPEDDKEAKVVSICS